MDVPITYLPGFVANPDQVFHALWNELDWERRPKVPRREYYANQVEVPYSYGKGLGEREYLPRPWHAYMTALGVKLTELTGHNFEACFLNGYENQSDFLGPHADDSPEMDDNRPIAIISLGVEREIWFNLQGQKEPITKLKLQHGSLCLMHAGMQDTHYHRIPKAGFMCGERISLTYRGYVDPRQAA